MSENSPVTLLAYLLDKAVEGEASPEELSKLYILAGSIDFLYREAEGEVPEGTKGHTLPDNVKALADRVRDLESKANLTGNAQIAAAHFEMFERLESEILMSATEHSEEALQLLKRAINSQRQSILMTLTDEEREALDV